MNWQKDGAFHLASDPPGYHIAKTMDGPDVVKYAAIRLGAKDGTGQWESWAGSVVILVVRSGSDAASRERAIQRCKDACEADATEAA